MFNFLSYYGMFALTHLFVQIGLSHREYLNQINEKQNPYYPSIAIIIPSYNEDSKNIISCVNSCLNQEYKKPFKIYFIDDGSKDKSGLKAIKKLNNDRIIIIEHKENKGKREAQKSAFDIIPKDIEIFVTIDSDAKLDSRAIYYLVQPFRDKKIGAVTGNVEGKIENFLSRLIHLRYWGAFNLERGSQSLYNCIFCCCGVLSAYRIDIVKKVKEGYVNDYFLGIKKNFGDDRFMSFLVMQEGYGIKYAEKSKATTSVPLKIRGWLRQQLRWNISYYTYLTYNIRLMFKKPKILHPYAWYDLTIQTVLPFMLIISLGLMIFNTIFLGITFLFGYLAVLVGVALIRGIYAFARTKEWQFFLLPAYAILHVFLLIPLRLFSLTKLKYNVWDTRTNLNNRQYSKL